MHYRAEMNEDIEAADLRRRLVEVALSIISSVSGIDAARLVGMNEDDYCAAGSNPNSCLEERRLRLQRHSLPSGGKPPERKA
jgi:hypothetical protein